MTVFAFKSVDFVSEKGVATKKSLPPVKVFLLFVKFATINTAGIDSVRARQKAREFFPTPFFLDFVRKTGF